MHCSKAVLNRQSRIPCWPFRLTTPYVQLNYISDFLEMEADVVFFQASLPHFPLPVSFLSLIFQSTSSGSSMTWYFNICENLSPQQEIQKIAEKMPQTNALQYIIKQFRTISLIFDIQKFANVIRLLGEKFQPQEIRWVLKHANWFRIKNNRCFNFEIKTGKFISKWVNVIVELSLGVKSNNN